MMAELLPSAAQWGIGSQWGEAGEGAGGRDISETITRRHNSEAILQFKL